MSASLVGSEMCIRDSLQEPVSSSLQQVSAVVCAVAPMLFHRWLLSTRAVSYTHLTLPTICSV
eukprot:1903893-Alexandrium_andersonii.AAC.1